MDNWIADQSQDPISSYYPVFCWHVVRSPIQF